MLAEVPALPLAHRISKKRISPKCLAERAVINGCALPLIAVVSPYRQFRQAALGRVATRPRTAQRAESYAAAAPLNVCSATRSVASLVPPSSRRES